MYYTLCRSLRGSDGESKVKEAYKPSKVVMVEYKWSQFLLYRCNIKLYQASIQKGRKQEFTEAENWI